MRAFQRPNTGYQGTNTPEKYRLSFNGTAAVENVLSFKSKLYLGIL